MWQSHDEFLRCDVTSFFAIKVCEKLVLLNYKDVLFDAIAALHLFIYLFNVCIVLILRNSVTFSLRAACATWLGRKSNQGDEI